MRKELDKALWNLKKKNQQESTSEALEGVGRKS